MAVAVLRRRPPHRAPQSFKRRSLNRRFLLPYTARVVDGGYANLAISITISTTEDTDPTANLAISISMNADIGVTQLFGATEGHRGSTNPYTEGHRA